GLIPGPLSAIAIRRTFWAASSDPSMVIRGGTLASVHASSALRHKLLKACRSRTSSPSTLPKWPDTMTSPPRVRASGRISSAARRLRHLHRTPDGRAHHRETLADDVRERSGVVQDVLVAGAHVGILGNPKQPSPGRIERAHVAAFADDEEP